VPSSRCLFGVKTRLEDPEIQLRSALESGLSSDIAACPKSATFGLIRRSKGPYSMISSARPTNGREKVNPSALAVLRLITKSTFVFCSTREQRRVLFFAPYAMYREKTVPQ
jgi:hypothetical protein